MPTVLCEKLKTPHLSPEWVEVPETHLREALADFPIDWQGLKDQATPEGTVLHTPAGRFRVRLTDCGQAATA